MELTDAQYARIAPYLPTPSGHTKLGHRQVLNALLFVAENGCKWRSLPASFGNWHTIYVRLNRWAKQGVLERVFAELQHELLAQLDCDALSLDSTIIKLHPDGSGARRTGGASRLDARAAAGRPNSMRSSPMSAHS